MPQSFTCLHYHLVFSTWQRQPLIDAAWQSRLFQYLGGILRAQSGALISAGGMPDHVHLLAVIEKQNSVSNTLRDIKSNSSRWIHETVSLPAFAWQRGYAAFAVSFSNLDTVQAYIENQREHHRVRTFQDEFRELLRRHSIEFDERYVWD